MNTALRPALCAVAIMTTALVPLTVGSLDLGAPAAAASAVSRPSPATDFTAGVRSIHHASGTVTLAGTAPVGTSIELAGDVLDPVWTEADGTGAWTGTVRVRPGGQHTVRVTSAVSGRVIEIPVHALILIPPTMGGTVDAVARTLEIEGFGFPGASFALTDAGVPIGDTEVDDDGHWHFTVRDLAFGDHPIEALETFDGAVNGTVGEVYALSGAASVTEASASRETDRVTLTGTAPRGTDLAFASGGTPVTGADGRPLGVHVGDDGRWQVAFPIPTDVRLLTVDVTTHDGAAVVGSTTAGVTVPFALSGSVEQAPDGQYVFAGTGELGGTIALETEDGVPVRTEQGAPIETVTGPPAQQDGYSWRLAVAPRDLPDDADAVVVRQRVQGVEQGGLRLVLPGRTHRPDPGAGAGAGPEVVTGTATLAPHLSSARVVPAHGRLATTGAELLPGAAWAALSTALGSALLVVARTARRRRLHR